MDFISTVLSLLTVIIGGVCVMVIVSTKTLRDSRDDLTARVAFLESERTRDKAEIGSLQTAVTFWRSAARGDEKLDHLVDLVVSLSALLTEHHGEARTNWVAVTAALGHLGTAMDRLADALDGESP